MLSKSRSCNEIRKRFDSNSTSSMAEHSTGSRNGDNPKARGEHHKTVIYFGDSISSRRHHGLQQRSQQSMSSAISRNLSNKSEDFQHARRLCEEMVLKRHYSIRHPKTKPNANREDKIYAKDLSTETSKARFKSEQSLVMKELKSVVEVKLKNQIHNGPQQPVALVAGKPIVPVKNIGIPHRPAPTVNIRNDRKGVSVNGDESHLPSFVESVVNGVINIKIDGSFDAATKLVESFGRTGSDNIEFSDNTSDIFLDVGGEVNNVYFDWSFVQDWRSG